MSTFTTQSIVPTHADLLELPAGPIPGLEPVGPSAREIVESVVNEPVQAEHPADIPAEEIALEAYLLFEARGFEHGHDVEDWLAAEALVRERRTAPIVATIESAPDPRN